jgi:hypothetical protein
MKAKLAPRSARCSSLRRPPGSAQAGRAGSSRQAAGAGQLVRRESRRHARLSIGTAEPESIYEATIEAKLTARSPSDTQGESEIQLPLPPQIISLGDLSLSIDGADSDAVALEKTSSSGMARFLQRIRRLR